MGSLDLGVASATVKKRAMWLIMFVFASAWLVSFVWYNLAKTFIKRLVVHARNLFDLKPVPNKSNGLLIRSINTNPMIFCVTPRSIVWRTSIWIDAIVTPMMPGHKPGHSISGHTPVR